MKLTTLAVCCMFLSLDTFAQLQATQLRCRVFSDGVPLSFATVYIPSLKIGNTTDSLGQTIFNHLPIGDLAVEASFVGHFSQEKTVHLGAGANVELEFHLAQQSLETVVVTGTMREIRRSDSPIPVDIVSSKLFLRNPTPNLFESVGMVSGVQPVVNCSVCNTGDIHINGMEGSYTQVLLDGMPIVSGLGTVYGLMGIPNSLIDRIEVVKGPAGALYGSEAMAGQINIITKNPQDAPLASIDFFTTSWAEANLDLGMKYGLGQSANGLLGLNGFWFNEPFDKNGDAFTDMTQQKRLSIFNKWQWNRPGKKLAQMGARYVWEDRWGGQTGWNKSYRGGDERYGESIYTNRLELFGHYQLPTKAPIFLQASYNLHDQDSYYGLVRFDARQSIGFAQAYFEQMVGQHRLLVGTAVKYSNYNDNTPATSKADRTTLPGIFLQDEWHLNAKNEILSGLRLDLHHEHGPVWSPRLALLHRFTERQTFRASLGSGFRVVSLFTEDHAALSGAREVVITEQLRPERSWSGNLNYNLKIPRAAYFLNLDLSAFYTYFTNRILPDYDTDPQKIIYSNLKGNAVTRGLTLQMDYSDGLPVRINAGITYMDVFQENEGGGKSVQVHAPKWSGTCSANYTHPTSRISIDLTTNWYAPQRLPVVPNDFRPEYSPWFALLNLQVSRKFSHGFELYGGVKNLLNFVPKDPILRPFDPFDKEVDDPIGNPYGYTFDPSYNYAPMQGIRGFMGLRWKI